MGCRTLYGTCLGYHAEQNVRGKDEQALHSMFTMAKAVHPEASPAPHDRDYLFRELKEKHVENRIRFIE